MKGFTNIPVRFFVVDIEPETEETDLFEVDEQAFLDHHGEITYYRATMRRDGVSQIELTKGLGVWLSLSSNLKQSCCTIVAPVALNCALSLAINTVTFEVEK